MTNSISIKKQAADVIKRPRITEKAAYASENNQYVFEVTKDSTKASIAEAIKELYKVTPIRVNVVHAPSKEVRVRGRIGIKQGHKKAYVTLKKGDKIDLA